MNRINPKSHDALFKWLIAAFTEEFFAHYFPGVRIGKYRFIDKEFISRYEALKESLKGDLFLLMEVETDGELRELAIRIEHQSGREDVSERMFEYLCYVWLLKKKPVWSMVIYTDDASWKKKVPDQFCYAFSRENHRQFFRFDVIKVRQEKSSDLIRKHSLLCRLLALKADDTGTDPEYLIHEIYQEVARMKDRLDRDRLLLIHQWTDFYKKVPDETIRRIRKEVNMDVIETTISEHIFNQGISQGINQGNTLMLSRQMAKKYHISPEKLSVQLEILNNDELLELGDRILDCRLTKWSSGLSSGKNHNLQWSEPGFAGFRDCRD